MYLVDTNVWLERLLGQEKADEVGRFLDRVLTADLWISDFCFHSISLILIRLGRNDALLKFVQDVFVDGAVSLARLDPSDTPQILAAVNQFALDFDDAYQYALAEKYNLALISFDSDFDRTERGRKTPAQIL